APPSGSVVATGDGAFVFTPTQAARDLARQSEGPDAASFTITVRDAQYVTNVDVTVPVTPSPAVGVFDIDSTSIPAGGSPTGPVLVGDRLYVVSEDGFVQVVDRATNTVVGAPIAVDWASSNIAAAPAVDRVYVNSPWAGTISVIDTTTGTVVDTIWVDPSPDYQGWTLAQELIVSADGTRLYASGEDGTVSVIDTATNDVITSQSLGYFTDLAVSEDGSRLYGTSGATVSVIDTASLTTTAEITVGPEWDLTRSSSEFTDVTSSVAVNADGTRAYVTYHVNTVELASGGYSNGWFITDSSGRLWRVTGGYEVVTVVDVDPSSTTYGTQLATARLPEGAQDVAISADGDLLYVSGADGRTVSVLDTATCTVLGTFMTDPDGSTSGAYGPYRFLLVDPDTGTLYVTDYTDGTVYAVAGAPGGVPAAVLT
ncbi:MAG: YncE family protein, partial [Rhodococcus sp. (in: high G+C Gram-positive bacteria)]